MTPTEHPERRLILAYAPASARGALAALLALDDALARLLRTTSEPALGQIRLAWWRERLVALDAAPPPAEPVLQNLAAELLPRGVTGAALARIIDGWDVLIEAEAFGDAEMRDYASGRGGRLFAAAALALGGDETREIEAAGQGWALADLSRGLNDADAATQARALAAQQLDDALSHRWPRPVRVLGILALTARMDLEAGNDPIPIGSPGRMWRMLRFRFTGRDGRRP